MQVGLDRGERDVHDGRVEDDHELREADEDEDDPGICCVARMHSPQRNWTDESGYRHSARLLARPGSGVTARSVAAAARGVAAVASAVAA